MVKIKHKKKKNTKTQEQAFVDTVGIEMSLAPITRLRSSVPGLSHYLKGHWFELVKIWTLSRASFSLYGSNCCSTARFDTYLWSRLLTGLPSVCNHIHKVYFEAVLLKMFWVQPERVLKFTVPIINRTLWSWAVPNSNLSVWFPNRIVSLAG